MHGGQYALKSPKITYLDGYRPACEGLSGGTTAAGRILLDVPPPLAPLATFATGLLAASRVPARRAEPDRPEPTVRGRRKFRALRGSGCEVCYDMNTVGAW